MHIQDHISSFDTSETKIHMVFSYIPNSIKVALGIGNYALGIYCLAVTQAKHWIVFVCPNAQCPIANDQ